MYTFATLEALQTGIPTAQLTLASTPHSALALVSLGIVTLAAVGIGLFSGRRERGSRLVGGRMPQPATC